MIIPFNNNSHMIIPFIWLIAHNYSACSVGNCNWLSVRTPLNNNHIIPFNKYHIIILTVTHLVQAMTLLLYMYMYMIWLAVLNVPFSDLLHVCVFVLCINVMMYSTCILMYVNAVYEIVQCIIMIWEVTCSLLSFKFTCTCTCMCTCRRKSILDTLS